MKKNLTNRERRKQQQTRGIIFGALGGVVVAGLAVGAFAFSQGGLKSDVPEKVAQKWDTSIETVESDGSDPTIKDFNFKGELPLTENIPKLQKTPRIAWDSVLVNMSNSNAGGKTPSEGNHYLWDVKSSTQTSGTFVNEDNSCSVVYSNTQIDGDFSTDEEATKNVLANSSLSSFPITLWTSYNLRDNYTVQFAQTEPVDGAMQLVRATVNNDTVFTVAVDCGSKGTQEEIANAVNDAMNSLILIVPIETQ